jgi:hypothetical protein
MLPKINIVAFILGQTNIAQCFSCGNGIHWKEGQDPLDEELHINCKHLRQITSNTQVIYCTQKKKLLLKNNTTVLKLDFSSDNLFFFLCFCILVCLFFVCLFLFCFLFCFDLSCIRTHIIESLHHHVREYRRDNKKFTEEKPATYGTQDKDKHNTICVGPQYSQTNTDNVNKA